jgi:hypothetical protein
MNIHSFLIRNKFKLNEFLFNTRYIYIYDSSLYDNRVSIHVFKTIELNKTVYTVDKIVINDKYNSVDLLFEPNEKQLKYFIKSLNIKNKL